MGVEALVGRERVLGRLRPAKVARRMLIVCSVSAMLSSKIVVVLLVDLRCDRDAEVKVSKSDEERAWHCGWSRTHALADSQFMNFCDFAPEASTTTVTKRTLQQYRQHVCLPNAHIPPHMKRY